MFLALSGSFDKFMGHPQKKEKSILRFSHSIFQCPLARSAHLNLKENRVA